MILLLKYNKMMKFNPCRESYHNNSIENKVKSR